MREFKTNRHELRARCVVMVMIMFHGLMFRVGDSLKRLTLTLEESSDAHGHNARKDLAVTMGCYPNRCIAKPVSDVARTIHKHQTPNFFPMCSFKFVTSEANRLGSGLLPERHGAAVIQRES